MTRKAGSIVINRLRDRIRLGRYFGRWQPGDRLPSVRDVATLEQVDRKTAAAAYRRLEQEGLVRVEPRSGVYLQDGAAEPPDPLRRLHLQWLERTLASAAELGLEPEAASRMFQGVLAVQRRRIPLADPDTDHAALLGRELAQRTALNCTPTAPERLPARSGPLHDPPFIIATPRGADALKALHHRIPLVMIGLAAGLFDDLCAAAARDRVRVLVGSRTLKREVERALEQGLADHPDRVEVVLRDEVSEDKRSNGADSRVLVWPAGPGRTDGASAGGPDGAGWLISRETIAHIRRQVARSALEQVSRSSAYATPA